MTKSNLNLKYLGDFAGLYGVIGQCGFPRNVVDLGQVLDAPSDVDVRTPIESARDEALMERRRWNLLVGRESSFFISWAVERLDLLARGLLSRVIGITSRNRSGFPPWVLILHHHPLAFLMLTVFRGSLTNLIVTCPGEQFFVTENDVFLGDTGVHSPDDEIVSWRERRFHVYEAFSLDARSHLSVPVETFYTPLLEIAN